MVVVAVAVAVVAVAVAVAVVVVVVVFCCRCCLVLVLVCGFLLVVAGLVCSTNDSIGLRDLACMALAGLLDSCLPFVHVGCIARSHAGCLAQGFLKARVPTWKARHWQTFHI